jgi:hypothetical protein
VFRDCWRCGYGWHTKHSDPMPCPCCKGQTDEWAAEVKAHRMIRVVGEQKDWTCPQCHKTMNVKIMVNSLGEHGLAHVH